MQSIIEGAFRQNGCFPQSNRRLDPPFTAEKSVAILTNILTHGTDKSSGIPSGEALPKRLELTEAFFPHEGP